MFSEKAWHFQLCVAWIPGSCPGPSFLTLSLWTRGLWKLFTCLPISPFEMTSHVDWPKIGEEASVVHEIISDGERPWALLKERPFRQMHAKSAVCTIHHSLMWVPVLADASPVCAFGVCRTFIIRVGFLCLMSRDSVYCLMSLLIPSSGQFFVLFWVFLPLLLLHASAFCPAILCP